MVARSIPLQLSRSSLAVTRMWQEAPAEGAEPVNGDGGDNQAGAGDGNANNNNGVGGNRRQVRWLDFGVLTRLAVGFMLLSQGEWRVRSASSLWASASCTTYSRQASWRT